MKHDSPLSNAGRWLLNRRDFLRHGGTGLGGIALLSLLAEQALLGADKSPIRPQWSPAHPNAPRPPHIAAKAKNVLVIFCSGACAHLETWDYKPELIKRHGQKFDPGGHVEAATSEPGNVLKSPFEFKQHGQCGRWVSSLLPHLATCVDDSAFLMGMASKTNVHGPASYMMNSGFVSPGFPCMGAWISYALGGLSDNLPAFVVLPDARGLPYNQKSNFSSAFLPVAHQGTVINAGAPAPIADLFAPASAKHITKQSERDGLALLNKLNRQHLEQWPGDSRLESRIASYELAAKMQLSAPELLDLGRLQGWTLKPARLR